MDISLVIVYLCWRYWHKLKDLVAILLKIALLLLLENILLANSFSQARNSDESRRREYFSRRTIPKALVTFIPYNQHFDREKIVAVPVCLR